MYSSSHRVGGGVRAGRPIIGAGASRLFVAPVKTLEQIEAEQVQREAEIKARLESYRLESERREAEAQKRIEYDEWVAGLRKAGPIAGSTVETLVDEGPATVFCELLSGRPRIWVLARLDGAYPREPVFHLGARGRHGMRAFLVERDVRRILTADDVDFLRQTGRLSLTIKVYKVRVLGRSVTGKSLTVEIADWSNVIG